MPIVLNFNSHNFIYMYFFLNNTAFLFSKSFITVLLSNTFKKYYLFFLTKWGTGRSRYNWCSKRYRRDWTKYFTTVNNKRPAQEFLHFNEFNTQGFFDFRDRGFIINNCVALKRVTGLFKLKVSLSGAIFRRVKYLKFWKPLYNKFLFKRYLKRITNGKYIRTFKKQIEASIRLNEKLYSPEHLERHYDKNNLERCIETRNISDDLILRQKFFKNLKFGYRKRRMNKIKHSYVRMRFRGKNTITNKYGINNNYVNANRLVGGYSPLKTLITFQKKKSRRKFNFERSLSLGGKIKRKLSDMYNNKKLNDYVPFSGLIEGYNSKNNFLFSNFLKNTRDNQNRRSVLENDVVRKTRYRYFHFSNKTPKMMEAPKTRFKRKFKATVLSNRNIFAKVLKKRVKYQKKFSYFLKNLIKKPFLSFLYSYDFTLYNILLRSHFFLGVNDIKFFLKNKFIYVNGKVVENGLKVLNESDKINFVFNKKYTLYYRRMLSIFKNSFYKLSKYCAVRKEQKYDRWQKKKFDYPKWLKNYMHFRGDIPNFLEVDFLTMTIIILYNPTHFFEFNKDSFRFLALYQREMYNWRYII